MKELEIDNGESKAGKVSASKAKIIIISSLIVAVGLAVGLGVGLGLGLKNVQHVEVTQAETRPTTGPGTTGSYTTAPDLTTTAPAGPGPWLNYRLPDTLTPSHYRLTLQPDLTNENYTGTNEMTFKVMSTTNYVIIHAHASLVIVESSVELERKESNGSRTNMAIVRKFRWPDHEFYVIEAENSLMTGEECVLTISFSNSLTATIVGIYMSTYLDPYTGVRKGVVSSTTQPTDSRRGYPCFDEPALKIEYTTIIIHEHKHTALSNMPVQYTKDLGNGWNETGFYKSVVMSTYLACFAVGELEYVEAFSGRGIPLRIYGAKYQIEGGQGDYALNVTKAMFDKYEELYGMNYSLPKYDQIALPEFYSGAMENWGLVTYRETYLMWDPKESTTRNKQLIALVIAHELVHQWYGNIVTMKWWDNIWLNEGFASYFVYDGFMFAEPTWKADAFNVIFDVHSAKEVDQSIGSHPIVVNVNTPSQIMSVFDTITYQKGAAVLRYMNEVLGRDLFIGGLQHYLKKRNFSNADEQDLWSDVQEYVDRNGGGYNISYIMDAWVQQQGYPVLHANVNGTQVTVRQDQMLIDPNANRSSLPESKYNYRWNVKFDYFTQSDGTVKDVWLNASNDEVVFTLSSPETWIKLNIRETGIYRVHYDSATWHALSKQLMDNHTVFTETDRAQLMDDCLNLAPAGLLTYPEALNMTRYLDKEQSYFVWTTFSSGTSRISSMLSSTDKYENFKKYYLSRVKHIADKLGWDATTGSHEDKLNRLIVFGLALRYGDKDALSNATSLFRSWKDNGTYIHPDVRQLVYQYGVAGGNKGDWEFVLRRYINETVAGEKINLLRGLAATTNVALITSYSPNADENETQPMYIFGSTEKHQTEFNSRETLLNFTKDPTIIKEQDFFTCISYISQTKVGNRMAWSWVRLNWMYLAKRFRIENLYLGRLVPDIVSNYNAAVQKWEVEDFFARYPEAGAGESRRRSALLQIDLNIAWLAANEATIGAWLADRVKELP